MTTEVDLAVGISTGLALGIALSWLWWRARYAELRAERDAATAGAITEITQASARAAAEQTALQFRQLEERAEHSAAEDLNRRQQALHASVEDLVRPVKEQLARYQAQVEGFQHSGTQMHGELKQQLEHLAVANAGLEREARNLVSALRRPEVRGGWGEQQLRRIIELAGMIEHCDFDEQVHSQDSEGARQRPDLVVHLPNAREVIVDAKVPLDAFLEGLDADDKETRRAAMVRHASQLRSHVEALSKKAYWQGVEGSVDFVVAFIPGDPLLAAAYEHDPSIFEYALARQVIISTPTTLIALLKAVAYGWQQEAATRNAQEVVQAGRELYGRFRTLTTHIVSLGRNLRMSVETYNKFVGSLETRVIPQAKRFEQLEVVGAAEEGLAATAVITEFPRQLVAPELSALIDEDSADQA